MKEEESDREKGRERHPEQIRFRRRSTVELTAFRRRVNPFISVAPFYIHVRQFPSVSPRLLLPLFFPRVRSFLFSFSSFCLCIPLSSAPLSSASPCPLSSRNFRLPLIVLSLLVFVYFEDSLGSQDSRDRKLRWCLDAETESNCGSVPLLSLFAIFSIYDFMSRLPDMRRISKSQIKLVIMAE